jgi:hypothetical protein
MASELLDIPPRMRRLYRRFERWRSAHTGRLPIPERLWTAAAELARQYGVFATAKALHLEYGKLKQLADAPVPALKKRVVKALTALRQTQSGTRRRSTVPRRGRSRFRPPAFLELLAPRPGSSRECRVELEGPRGRMRIEFKGIATAELVALSRALWDGSAPTDQGEA